MPGVSRKNKKALLGKKVGMTQIFGEDGSLVPVTVLEAGPCSVLQVKTEASDGYRAYQLGFGARGKKARRPEQARFDKVGVEAKRFVREVPYVDPADVLGTGQEEGVPGEEGASGPEAEGAEPSTEEGSAPPDQAEASARQGAGPGAETGEVQPGASIGVGVFRDTARVDVQGVTKGRGFAGTIKRHGFSSGDRSHGSKNVREPGSIGQHTDPGRVFKGKRMAGQAGHVQRKARNLEVVRIDEERNLLVVKGGVPGPNDGYVYIEESLI